ncbi:MAG: MBL fold metallo-hydrolase [Clostridia bacterium]|nr:MBL fold metallo-hydrolase [Clostridia bacterium]
MRKIYKIIVCFLFLIIIIGDEYETPLLTVYFFDVGQADCAYLSLPNGENMLIDCGNTLDGSRIVNYLSLMGVKKIEHLVLTHPHEDHIGGADNIINSFSINRVYTPQIDNNTLCFMELESSIKRQGIYKETLSYGKTIIKEGFLEIICLSPTRKIYEELNEYSVVLNLRFFKNTFLFMGDAEKENEKDLLSRNVLSDCDLIKIGHHGSKTSSSEKFIKTTAPEYAIISVGDKNTFGHPNKKVLQRLENAGAEIYRTDLCGTVIAECDGRKIKIHTTDICLDGDVF